MRLSTILRYLCKNNYDADKIIRLPEINSGQTRIDMFYVARSKDETLYNPDPPGLGADFLKNLSAALSAEGRATPIGFAVQVTLDDQKVFTWLDPETSFEDNAASLFIGQEVKLIDTTETGMITNVHDQDEYEVTFISHNSSRNDLSHHADIHGAAALIETGTWESLGIKSQCF